MDGKAIAGPDLRRVCRQEVLKVGVNFARKGSGFCPVGVSPATLLYGQCLRPTGKKACSHPSTSGYMEAT